MSEGVKKLKSESLLKQAVFKLQIEGLQRLNDSLLSICRNKSKPPFKNESLIIRILQSDDEVVYLLR